MEKITNAELLMFVERDGPLFNLLKAWTIDFLERIKPANSEDWAEAWSTHVLDAIYDETRADNQSAAMHKEKREKLSGKTQQFTESGYNKLDYNNFIHIISHNCRNRKIYDIYGIDRNMTKFIWEHVRSTRSEGNSSKVGPLRNYLEHDVKENKGLNSEAAGTDIKNLIDGLKSRETGFLRGFPYNASSELHKHAYNVIREVHKLWERLPANEKGWDVWEPEEIIPAPAGLIPEPVPNPTPFGGGNRPIPVSRSNPQYLIFLVDESGSMENKGEQVVSALNNTLEHLKRTQRKGSAGTKNYFYVSILGYRRFMNDSTQEIEVAVEDLVKYNSNTPTNIRKEKIRPLIAVTHKDYTTRNDWVKFEAYGGTPMKEAFAVCKELVGNWEINADRYISEANPGLKADEKLHPPIIINITDGRYDDSMSGEGTLDVSKSPAGIIREIQSRNYQRFYDKPVVMNVHITDVGGTDTTAFPSNVSSNAEPYLRELFSMSSLLTENQVLSAQNGGYAVSSGAKAFLYNANPADLTKILIIGTQRTQPTVTGRNTIPEDLGF